MKNDRVNELLENLSEEWATPIAQEFMGYASSSKFDEALKMLLTQSSMSENDAHYLIAFYKNRNVVKHTLVELGENEFKNLKEGDTVLVSYGGSLFETTLRVNTPNKENYAGLSFFVASTYEFKAIEEATQVWLVLEI